MLIKNRQETAEKILQKGINEESVYDLVQPNNEKGCTQWFSNFKVQISGLLGEIGNNFENKTLSAFCLVSLSRLSAFGANFVVLLLTQ
jgi:hypothetical protein